MPNEPLQDEEEQEDKEEGGRGRSGGRNSVWAQTFSSKFAAERPAEMSWSNILVQDLLHKDVIDSRNMAILKEQTGSLADSALLMDLRHDKELRSKMKPSKPFIRESDVLAEAKKILRNEEKERRLKHVQNKVVDEEIDRFQHHIVKLRKMNKRLESLACPPPKRGSVCFRLKSIQSSGCQSSVFPHKEEYVHRISKKDMSAGRIQNQNIVELNGSQEMRQEDSVANSVKSSPEMDNESSFPGSHVHHQSSNFSRERLVICGSKLNEHEILQFHSNPVLRESQVLQDSVLDRMHQRYADSERLRLSQDGTNLIRHSSPTESEMIIPEIVLHAHHNSTNVNLEGRLEEYLKKIIPLPAEGPRLCSVQRESNEVQEDQCQESPDDPEMRKKPEPDCLKVAVECPSAKSGKVTSKQTENIEDKRRLNMMTHAYTKWMVNVCQRPHSNFNSKLVLKNNVEKLKEDHTFSKTGKREEKIEQVLRVLKEQKDAKRDVNQEENVSKAFYSECPLEAREGKQRKVFSGSYENRLKAQKELIIQQKSKLEEQQKMIEDFKLTQLQLETEKAKLQTQKTLDFVLGSCDSKVKAQAKTLKSSLSLVDLSPADPFVQRMEQRAMEQKQKKFLSLERRKHFEEERLKKIREADERKRCEEEELIRKRNAELREARRLEREAREEARKEKERMITLERRAEAHSCSKVMKWGFRCWKNLMALRQRQLADAEHFHEYRLLYNSFSIWKKQVDSLLEARMSVANEFYQTNLLRHCFLAIYEGMQAGETRMQVAEDLHDFRLQEKFFHHWVQFTQEKHLVTLEKLEKAEHHHNRNLLKNCVRCWRRLPLVAQEEREKERRKMIWRDKVQEFLPDFRPILSTD